MRPVAHARSLVVNDPAGPPVLVAASPCGDLLVLWPEDGGTRLLSWVSLLPGLLGFASLLLNRLVFRRRWRVVAHAGGTPSGRVLHREDVDRTDVGVRIAV